MEVYLISCVSKKQNTPMKASDLYVSEWFKKARIFVGNNSYYILSAKHGLLNPETVIEPYEKTLNKMSKLEKTEWSNLVVKQIKQVIPNNNILVFLAGRNYREFVIHQLIDYEIQIPMKGLGIGQQLKWLNENISSRG